MNPISEVPAPPSYALVSKNVFISKDFYMRAKVLKLHCQNHPQEGRRGEVGKKKREIYSKYVFPLLLSCCHICLLVLHVVLVLVSAALGHCISGRSCVS